MTEKMMDAIRMEVRENQIPYFDDEEIEYYFDKNKGDFNATVYELLTIKSEDSSLIVSGLNSGDTSNYFKMLASKYRRFNSGTLKGG